MKSIYPISLLLLCLLAWSSCEDKLDLSNPNQITTDTFWEKEADFEQAVVTLYTPLKNMTGGYAGTRGLMIRLCRSDEFIWKNGVADIYTMHRFLNTNTNSVAQEMFAQCYSGIYRANSILQELEKKQFDSGFVNKIKAETYFMRGFYFHVLAKEFKDVPLRLEASQDPATFPLANSSQEEIYNQSVSDLKQAAGLLPVDNAPGKPTKGTANMLIGKTYVYQGKWQDAKDVLEPLTQSPYHYKLMSDYSWNFDEAHENNEESIFEVLFEDLGGNDIWGDGENVNSTQSTSIPCEYAAAEVGGWFQAVVTEQMMDILCKEKDKNGNYDPRTLASVAWDYPGCMYYNQPFADVFKESPTNKQKYWPLKHTNSKTHTKEVQPPKSFLNERLLRYADVLLLLAEAELELNDIPGAIGYIDQIRNRANLSPYSGPQGKEEVKEELIRQRAIEFFMDGERFYDLRRWGLLESAHKNNDPDRYANFQKRHYYLPIPAKELQTNELCKPSEGWE